MTELTRTRRVLFRHANGEAYTITRNGGSANPGYLFKPQGEKENNDRIVGTEDISEVVRAVLIEGCAIRCKNLSKGSQPYLKYRADELSSYEIGPEIARELGIPETGRAGEVPNEISRHAIEDAMDAFDAYQSTKSHAEIFDSFGEPRDFWVRSSRQRPNRVYPSKPIHFWVNGNRGSSGGWGGPKYSAAALHNAGFIIVDKDDRPVTPPEHDYLIRDADRIRLCALNYFIEPAREKGEAEVSIRASDLAAAIGLQDAFPNICQALGGEKFQQLAQVPPPTHTGQNPSSSTIFTYTLATQAEAQSMTDEMTALPRSATNLILYGPPGTGKTYRTAWEAIRLCLGEQTAAELAGNDKRDALMAEYRRLVGDGRIEFTTFHQSMSYEEFVEGLRPSTGDDAGEGPEDVTASTGGFHLKPHDGVFKRVSERARLDRGAGDGAQSLERDQGIFKLSLIGSDWRGQLSKAVEENGIVWSFGAGKDWSSPEFDDFHVIKQAWQQSHPDASGGSADISGTWYFRSSADVGSYVLLTVGKSRVVALGRVVGDYEFRGELVENAHFRKVTWIWVNEEGADRSQFYPEKFSSFQPMYQLASGKIDWDALEEIVFGAGKSRSSFAGRDHVLVIDEINRANISKVFGELITLLEPDKRLGMDNEIRLVLPYSKKPFGVPANLHIIGTMNTADRSIALLDTALRRRFTFRELMPDPTVLSTNIAGINLQTLLTKINDRIEYLFDREHQIGHAYFTGCKTRSDVANVMRYKVIPLLAEYFYEDWSKVAIVLGETGKGEARFIASAPLKRPDGMAEDDFSGERLRWWVKDQFDFSEFEA